MYVTLQLAYLEHIFRSNFESPKRYTIGLLLIKIMRLSDGGSSVTNYGEVSTSNNHSMQCWISGNLYTS